MADKTFDDFLTSKQTLAELADDEDWYERQLERVRTQLARAQAEHDRLKRKARYPGRFT